VVVLLGRVVGVVLVAGVGVLCELYELLVSVPILQGKGLVKKTPHSHYKQN
jgi:hypothetical protein